MNAEGVVITCPHEAKTVPRLTDVNYANRSRINVAISRAKCLAIVVADPRIANSAAGSISEMMLLNLFCKLAGYL